MDLAEPILAAIGELVACVTGRIIGRTFDLDVERARRIGENVVIGVFLGAAVLVTLLYS
ncbi:MAG: hypothetical protein KDH17_12135 [Rhodocyclaceae bacterium]|nr:hypothetical protein [Rhodocyclaceae bacterium]